MVFFLYFSGNIFIEKSLLLTSIVNIFIDVQRSKKLVKTSNLLLFLRRQFFLFFFFGFKIVSYITRLNVYRGPEKLWIVTFRNFNSNSTKIECGNCFFRKLGWENLEITTNRRHCSGRTFCTRCIITRKSALISSHRDGNKNRYIGIYWKSIDILYSIFLWYR